jgi:hypothetical protein
LDLRILNASDHPHHAGVRLHPEPKAVSRASLDSRIGQPCAVTDGVVRIELRPWEIATLTLSG